MARRFYCSQDKDIPMGRVQRDDIGELPLEILQMAHKEYQDQGHNQSFERIQQRCGFGVREVILLLADRVNRLETIHG